jgi:NADPH-dependent 2,4-dienoyl-CoA reductase/sulfur reductase-like enzyme
LGGILQQCIHDGFGIHRYKNRLSGVQYAQMDIDHVYELGIEVYLDTMVLEVTPDRKIFAINSTDGMLEISCGAIILAMGCRERTSSQAVIYGYRPAGVMTAGSVQRYINIEGYLPGTKAVILGSGDIGLIMARRMTLENINVQGVYEIMPTPGGLTRNIVQCLNDFEIPLHLSTTVTYIHGKKRIEGVTVAKVDENRKVIPGTEEYIECDLLVLSVGLIPENELSVQVGIQIDPKTKGPILDNNLMTSHPGIFAAGNVAVVFDLVDFVSISGDIAACGAVKFINGEIDEKAPLKDVITGENVGCLIPQKIRSDGDGQKATFFLRVKQPLLKGKLDCKNLICDDASKFTKVYKYLAPPEMISFSVENVGKMPIRIDVKEVQ